MRTNWGLTPHSKRWKGEKDGKSTLESENSDCSIFDFTRVDSSCPLNLHGSRKFPEPHVERNLSKKRKVV